MKSIAIIFLLSSYVLYAIPVPVQPGTQVIPQAQPAAQSTSFNLINAQKEAVLGSSVPLTGGVSLLGKDVTYGMNLIFTKLNRGGGINGALIKLSSMDDKYQPQIAEENITNFAKKSPFFIGCFGVEANLAMLPQIEAKKIISFFPIAGMQGLRKPELSNVINYRASIAREIEALVTYAVQKAHKRKIAIFYEENRWGESGAQAAEETLKKFNLKPVIKGSYLENTVNVSAASADLSKARPTAIICIAQIRPAYTFIQQVLNAGMQNVLFLGISDLAPMQELIKKSRGIDLICSSVVPDPVQSKLPIVVQYRADMKSYLPNVAISPFSLEGYICASLFTNALTWAAQPKAYTAVMQQFEAMKKYNFEGLSLDFNAQTRQLSSAVWINDATGKEWIQMFT